MYNKLLKCQLQKKFGTLDQVPESMLELLKVVSDSYDHYEEDRKMLEQGIDLSSNEMIELNRNLENDIKQGKKTADRLIASEAKLREIIDLVPHFIFAKDCNGKFILANKATAEVYGCTINDLLGKSDADFNANQQEVAHFIEEDRMVIENGMEKFTKEEVITDASGHPRILSTIKIPFAASGTDIPAVLGVSIDISERKKIEEELARSISVLEATIESTADGILVVDFDGKIVRFNSKFVELWSIPKHVLATGDDEKVLAFVLHQLTEPDAFITKVKDLYLNKKAVSFDILQFKDGRLFERYSQPQLINGECVGRVWSFRDITERKKAEEATSLLSDMISNTREAVIIRHPSTDNIIFWNEGAEKLYGYTAAEVMGVSTHGILQTRFPLEIGVINTIFFREGNWKGEVIHTSKKGSRIDVETSWTLRKDAAGVAIGILEIGRDITEKKNAELALIAREAQLTIATGIAKLGYWEFDVLRGLFTFNDEFYAIFKTTAAAEGGYHLTPEQYATRFMYPDDRMILHKVATSAIESDDPNFKVLVEHRFLYANGEVGHMSVHSHIIKDHEGRTIKTFGVNQDVTATKKGEETLRRSEATLELKNKELELKNKELEQFAYVASHDLQEPLRTTSSFAELLQKQYSGKLDDKANKYLTFIMQSSDRMKVLISDLLDYSRIGRKQEVELVDCNIMLKQVLEDLNKTITDEQAIIETGHLPVVGGCATEIMQLFQNLITNAIKFRGKGTNPKIRISARQVTGFWEFSFKDNGIGIDEMHNDRIFIIFQRLHNRGEYKGSGIGLSHCKKIVELHGGNIWVQSEPGNGSDFKFTLAEQSINPKKTNTSYETEIELRTPY